MKPRPSKRVLVIDSRPPTPDYDSGSLRMKHLLDLLLSLSCRVTFAASNPSAWLPLTDRVEDDIRNLQDAGIDVIRGPAIKAVNEHLRLEGGAYDAVLLSGGVYIARRHIRSVLDHAPQALVIFDTVDLHFVREYRQAKLTGNVNRLKSALDCKRDELAIAKMADHTLVVSPVEKETLEKERPEASVHVVSNIHEVFGCEKPFAERRDILFVGAFQHLPNIDAMTWLVNEIFPQVKEEIADLKIYIIGGNPPDEIASLKADDVIITGYVPDIAPYFERCRLSVAPLRFGAGVKGKVLMSLSYGVPVVATPIAAEGMHLEHGRDVLIADAPQEFSRSVIELYRNETLWNELSRNGLEILSRHFSFEAARITLSRLLDGRRDKKRIPE